MRLIDAIGLKQALAVSVILEDKKTLGQIIDEQPTIEPKRKVVFNRDIAIEAICDEVMLWFDISATQAYEIAETAVKRIEVRMEKTERGEQE